jgi:Tol biopolymer transport system component
VSHIHVMNADGSNELTLTPLDGYAMRPTWSPDGTRIAFETRRNPDGQDEIYVMNADGSDPVRLTNSRQPSWQAAWSPDGSKIAYVSYDETSNGNGDIFVMNPDGSGVVNLTRDTEFDNYPDWSPDGSRIAFSKGSDLYIMNADGTNPTRVDLSGGPAMWAAEPKWAPDGLSILYATYFWCDWGDTTCVEYAGPSATVVRLSDGFQWALPASQDGMTAGHWGWRPR